MCRRALAASGNLRLQKMQQKSSLHLSQPAVLCSCIQPLIPSEVTVQAMSKPRPKLPPQVFQETLHVGAVFSVRNKEAVGPPPEQGFVPSCVVQQRPREACARRKQCANSAAVPHVGEVLVHCREVSTVKKALPRGEGYWDLQRTN